MLEPDITPLDIDHTFRFACQPEVPCFNACCHDLNQVLTPYDVLVLKKFLKLPSSRFLQKYTIRETGNRSGLPVISLKSPGAEQACPFLTPEGCRVYAARPSSCRVYPLMRLARRDRATGRIRTEHYLLQEAHCQGFEAAASHTPESWEASQELAVYNLMNDQFLEIISLKNRLHPQPLSRELEQACYTACYDLDTFQEEHPAEAASDPKQLEAALRWVQAALLQEAGRLRGVSSDLFNSPSAPVRPTPYPVT